MKINFEIKDLEIEKLKELDPKNFCLLWVHDYWDGILSGTCNFNEDLCFFKIEDPNRVYDACDFCMNESDDLFDKFENGEITDDDFDRISEEKCRCKEIHCQTKYIIVKFTEEQKKKEIEYHKKFVDCVGDHWDTEASPFFTTGKFKGRTQKCDDYYTEAKAEKEIEVLTEDQILGYVVGNITRYHHKVETWEDKI